MKSKLDIQLKSLYNIIAYESLIYSSAEKLSKRLKKSLKDFQILIVNISLMLKSSEKINHLMNTDCADGLHTSTKTILDFLKINNKQLSGTNIAYHSNPNRDSLIFYLWKYFE